jgi:hypothetical protein
VFSVPTVFILGAGAGTDIDMPVGNKLSDAIADRLNFRFDAGRLEHGDGLIIEAIRPIAKSRNDDLNSWIGAARSVSKGIRYTRSIDSYIYTHRDDEKIRDCAKLAIVQSILNSERHSALFIAPNGDWNNEAKVNGSWLQVMMYLLQDKIVKAENFEHIFDNFVIINFNYDRCVEHFLVHALQHLYRITEKEAANALNKWNKVIHPYGSIGALPWQNGTPPGVAFGDAAYQDIWKLSQQIFTYNEQISDGGALAEIRTAIVNARRIVFLGFHFHQQNMDLLQTSVAGSQVGVWATAIQRSAPECDIIGHQIRQMVRTERPSHVAVLSNLACTDLLSQYGTTLLR